MVIDVKKIRDESIRAAKRYGVNVSQTLPLIDSDLKVRSADEVASRILAMHVVAASAYGFDKTKAISWLNQEALNDSLSEHEKRFLFEGADQSDRLKLQIEASWALAWAIGITGEMNFAKECDNSFVTQLPDLRKGESSANFRKRINPRSFEQIVSACDMAYCLHWAVRQADLDGKKSAGNFKPYVVIERRRALEWLLSEQSWDNISLDT